MDSCWMSEETRFRRMDLRWLLDPAFRRWKCAVNGMSPLWCSSHTNSLGDVGSFAEKFPQQFGENCLK